MQVMISFADGVEFQRLCEHYLGRRAEFIQDFTVATAPGESDRCVIYQVPDESALSTWIKMARPNWITTTWSWYDPKKKESHDQN
jgi:hypothetical protein